MTIALPPSTNPDCFSNLQRSYHGSMARRSSLQEGSSNTGCGIPRRSSLSSIAKIKITSQAPPSVIVLASKDSNDEMDRVALSKTPDSFLQSADKRRRYMRRGSKTSFMMRGSCAFKVELPAEWQASLSQSITKRVTGSSSSMMDDSMHSHTSSISPSIQSFESSSPICTAEGDLPSPSCGNFQGSQSFKSANMLDVQHAAQLEVLRRVNEEAREGLPLFHPDGAMRTTRRQSTVSLVTSALKLSYIDDQTMKGEM